jgi:hypothetical protein
VKRETIRKSTETNWGARGASLAEIDDALLPFSLVAAEPETSQQFRYRDPDRAVETRSNFTRFAAQQRQLAYSWNDGDLPRLCIWMRVPLIRVSSACHGGLRGRQ